jgi:hypothetical protein
MQIFPLPIKTRKKRSHGFLWMLAEFLWDERAAEKQPKE